MVFADNKGLQNPVLVDLGFATYEKDFRNLFSRCGTPGYVAPEVLNDLDYTCKADLFSLGVSFSDRQIILYMMVTRVNPFEDKSYEKLIQNNLKGYVDTTVLTTGSSRISPDCSSLFTKWLESSDLC